MVAMVTDGHNNKCVYGKRFLVYSTVNCCFARAKWYGNHWFLFMFSLEFLIYWDNGRFKL